MMKAQSFSVDQIIAFQSEQVRVLKQLRAENARLKKLVNELSLDKAILQDVARLCTRHRLSS
jgi:cell division protein FtsB